MAARGPRRRTRVPHSQQANPAAYAQIENVISLSSMGAGDDVMGPIVDNSVLFGNEFVRVVKAEFEWVTDITSEGSLMVAVLKRDESLTTPPSLDDQGTIIDLRSTRSLLRGPWLIPAGMGADATVKRKTIVLKKINLDRDDDIVMAITNHPNSDTTDAGAELQHLTKVWYRKIGG